MRIITSPGYSGTGDPRLEIYEADYRKLCDCHEKMTHALRLICRKEGGDPPLIAKETLEGLGIDTWIDT